MTKRKTTVKYFPYCAGIPFHFNYGSNIIHKMDPDSLERLFFNKTTHIVCNGGFFENLMTISIIKCLKEKFNNLDVSFICDEVFVQMYHLSGYKKSIWDMPNNILDNYTIPLFFDKNNENTFLNSLYDYVELKDYNGKLLRFNDSKAASFQIFRNSFSEWNQNYTPSFKNINIDKLNKQAKLLNFNFSSKFILLFPDNTSYSKSNTSCFSWSNQQIKEFIAMCLTIGYKVVLMSEKPEKYYGINCLMPEFNINNILYLLNNCDSILSKDVDFVLAGLLFTNAKLITNKIYNHLGIRKNRKYLKRQNKVLCSNELTPLSVYNFIK